MTQQELQALTEKMGAVAAYLQQCAQQAAEGVSSSQRQLQQTAQTFGAQSQQLISDAVDEIARQARQAIVQGVGQASDECNVRLKNTGDSANQAIYHLGQQVQTLQRAQHTLIWKAGLALLTGALLAMAGLGAYGWYLSRQAQKNSYPAAVNQALQTGMLVPCGEQLCAKIGKKPRRAGSNGEYLVLEP